MHSKRKNCHLLQYKFKFMSCDVSRKLYSFFFLFVTIISILVYLCFCLFVYLGYERIMMFNATFNNISAISWRSVLLVEETGENHSPAASYRHTLSHNVVSSTPRLSGIRTHNVNGDRN